MSVPLFTDEVDILLPPESWEMSLFSVVKIFTWDVWLALFVSLLVNSFVLSVIGEIQNKYLHQQSNNKFFNNVWVIIRIILRQDNDLKSLTAQKAFIWIIWMFSSMVISSVFGGVLLTSLVVRKARQINSVEDLAASSLQPILEAHSSTYGRFKRSIKDLVT
ncbi:hypothetical protein X975_11170, partial [Stegodyphus mimosarum]